MQSNYRKLSQQYKCDLVILQLYSYNNGYTSTQNDFTNQMRNMNDVLNDYKRQLEILAEQKESLSTSLSISRHQQLQITMKLEVLQSRLYNLERSQLEEWNSKNI